MNKKITLAICLLALGLSGCKTVPYPQRWSTFLRTEDPRWSKWLDTKVDVDLDGVPMWKFKDLPKLGFSRTPMLLTGKMAKYELIKLPPATMTHRELLWAIHKKYGLVVDFTVYGGDISLRVRSPEYIRLTE